jgi:hypothetical protein
MDEVMVESHRKLLNGLPLYETRVQRLYRLRQHCWQQAIEGGGQSYESACFWARWWYRLDFAHRLAVLDEAKQARQAGLG